MSTAELRQRIAELRRRRRNGPTLFELGATFALLAGAFWLLGARFAWWSALLAYVVIGFMQYRLVLASHEATHRTLLTPVWLNEAVGVFCASLVGVSLFNYRRAHLEHHKSPQTIEEDIDGYIYRPLLKARPGWERTRLLITGNYADILTKLKRKFVGDGGLEGAHALKSAEKPSVGEVLLQLAPIAAAQLGVLALFTYGLGMGWGYFAFWLAPLFTLALQLDRARTFLEHGYHYFYPGPPEPDLSRAPQSTVDIETSWLGRFLFAPFGFSEHQAHHAHLTVPYYNLPELRALLAGGQPGYVRRIRGSYPLILARMLRAPLAPEMAGKV